MVNCITCSEKGICEVAETKNCTLCNEDFCIGCFINADIHSCLKTLSDTDSNDEVDIVSTTVPKKAAKNVTVAPRLSSSSIATPKHVYKNVTVTPFSSNLSQLKVKVYI